jgi:hypothetical protein
VKGNAFTPHTAHLITIRPSTNSTPTLHNKVKYINDHSKSIMLLFRPFLLELHSTAHDQLTIPQHLVFAADGNPCPCISQWNYREWANM